MSHVVLRNSFWSFSISRPNGAWIIEGVFAGVKLLGHFMQQWIKPVSYVCTSRGGNRWTLNSISRVGFSSGPSLPSIMICSLEVVCHFIKAVKSCSRWVGPGKLKVYIAESYVGEKSFWQEPGGQYMHHVKWSLLKVTAVIHGASSVEFNWS